MNSPDILKLAYAANIVILLPVVGNMFRGNGPGRVFEGTVAASHGLELLVGSLWASILVASALGLIRPALLAPLLGVQIFYKALWLGTFIVPRLRNGTPIPTGISIVFAAIVLVYPALLLLAR
jgi:hypothetical protein